MMYSPVSQRVRVDEAGKVRHSSVLKVGPISIMTFFLQPTQKHLQRIHGHRQSSAPGRHVTFGRDKSAPIAFNVRKRSVETTGEVPWQYQRSTLKEKLEFPLATRYTYRLDAATGRLHRGIRPLA